ncbi:hypothetical protein ACIQPQ_10955 [Streptomyces sp. NPDC091281]|uniref:hypothetical protein n=1 Tax=Streptomyces sp. NPDC091281 TaxID=3365985 RepID=UPI003821AC2F
MRETTATMDSSTIPTREEIVARAAAIVPVLRENSTLTEKDRRVADASIQALRASGLARLATERQFGGYESDLLTQLLALIRIGSGCSSTGWVEAILLAGREMIKGLTEEAKRDVFGADPDAHMFTSQSPTGTITKVPGGYVANGKWGFCSGSDHAAWGFLMCLAKDDAGVPTGMAMAVVPKEELIKHDVWHVAGMSGTGSNTWEAQDVFVPEHRAVLNVAIRPGSTTAMSLTLLAVVLGTARGAQEFVVDQLTSGRAVTYSKIADAAQSPIVHVWLAEAVALFDRAEALLRDAAATTQGWLDAGTPVLPLDGARMRYGIADALESVRLGMNKLLDLGGASSFAASHPLQRMWRDVEVGSRHAQLNNYVPREDYGRTLLGNTDVLSIIE